MEKEELEQEGTEETEKKSSVIPLFSVLSVTSCSFFGIRVNCYALGDVWNERSNRLMENFDITDLISVSRQGDDGAKSQLVGHFRDYLRLLAHIHVKPLLQAKFDESDIVQETCLQAALSFDQFRGTNEQQLAAWLRQIMANKGAGMARKYIDTKMRDVRLEEHLQHDLDQSSLDMAKILPAGLSSPSHGAVRRERAVLLADAIGQLQDEQRDVLIMHGLQGLSMAEVAKTIGRSEASVWKLWARSLRELRNIAMGVEP